MSKAGKITDREISGAGAVYEKFFGRVPKKLKTVKYSGGERILVPLGEVISIRYRARKHEDKAEQFYEHAFKSEPALFWDESNGALIIKGALELEEEGITG